MKKKTFPENINFLYIYFPAWRVIFCFFWRKIKAGCPGVSRRRILEKVFLDKKTEKRANWANFFPDLQPKGSSAIDKNAIQMSGGASLSITFLQKSFAFQMFPYLERKLLPFLVVFFQQFSQTSFHAVRKKFWVESNFWKKGLVFILKVLGKINELLFCLFVDNSLPLLQTAIFKSRS